MLELLSEHRKKRYYGHLFCSFTCHRILFSTFSENLNFSILWFGSSSLFFCDGGFLYFCGSFKIFMSATMAKKFGENKRTQAEKQKMSWHQCIFGNNLLRKKQRNRKPPITIMLWKETRSNGCVVDPGLGGKFRLLEKFLGGLRTKLLTCFCCAILKKKNKGLQIVIYLLLAIWYYFLIIYIQFRNFILLDFSLNIKGKSRNVCYIHGFIFKIISVFS